MPIHLFLSFFKGPEVAGPIGILRGTEVLDSPVRIDFSTESFHAVFIWLTMEFNKCVSVTSQPLRCHCSCHSVTHDGGNLVHR